MNTDFSYGRVNSHHDFKMWRWRLLLILLSIGLLALLARVIKLCIVDSAFLQHQGDVRSVRLARIPAYRGMISDRNGMPLAISTPVYSVWINPKKLSLTPDREVLLSHLLQLPKGVLRNKISDSGDRTFIYLKRVVKPELASDIKALGIDGLYCTRTFHRYYPQAQVTAQLLGFTNIDDRGQEGIELQQNAWLQGSPGKKYVVKDRLGHTISELAKLREPHSGHDLNLSIDYRIQFHAYQALKEAVVNHEAQWGSVVVLDAKTSQVLGMVNYPSFNPNERHKRLEPRYRNRAATDQFEPGSVMKPFSVATALSSGQFNHKSVIKTQPGWMVVEGNTITDEHTTNSLTVGEVLAKSSNVGIAKMLLALDDQALYQTLTKVGFGKRTASGFPGEMSGVLPFHKKWRHFELATLGFGYGVSTTLLQLAHSYTVFANQGCLHPISLFASRQSYSCQQVMDPKVANRVLHMLEKATSRKGTGFRSTVKGYRVAGKTGTARIAIKNGYDKDHHVASFVGIVPASRPRLVIAIVIYNPKKGSYYGGKVAAPIFSNIASKALRVMAVRPDDVS